MPENQMKRLAGCAISCTYDDGKRWSIRNITPIRSADLWWEPKDPNQKALWKSAQTLSSDFFEEVATSPILVRMEVPETLKVYSIALEVYTWLTYRSSRIPWSALQMRLGAGYPLTQQGQRDFKRKFLEALMRVAIMYGEACKLDAEAGALIYNPGYPDVPRKLTKQ